MRLPRTEMVVRQCTGQKTAWFEVHRGDFGSDHATIQADLFAALARWIDAHPNQWVGAVNIHFDEDGLTERLSVMVADVPNPIPHFFVHGKRETPAKGAPWPACIHRPLTMGVYNRFPCPECQVA